MKAMLQKYSPKKGGSATRTGGVCNMDEGGPPRGHKQEHNEQDHKEQQQQEAANAAAFSDSSKQKKQSSEKPVQLKVYDCLKDIDIPEKDKVQITFAFYEDDVINAVAWLKETESANKLKKPAAAALKFACKESLSASPKSEDLTKENRKIAKTYDSDLNPRPRSSIRIVACHNHVEFAPPSGKVTVIKYDEVNFKAKFNEMLKKYNYTAIKRPEEELEKQLKKK